MSGKSDHKGLPSRRIARYRKAAHRPKGTAKADINVTPLVDVVLVLLIIFMVVTPMLGSGVPVDLPHSKYHDKRNDDGKDIIVSVTRQGDVYLMKDKMSLDKLGPAVNEEHRRSPEKFILLKGDNHVTYGKVRVVMENLNKQGIEDIQLGTEEPKNKE